MVLLVQKEGYEIGYFLVSLRFLYNRRLLHHLGISVSGTKYLPYDFKFDFLILVAIANLSHRAHVDSGKKLVANLKDVLSLI